MQPEIKKRFAIGAWTAIILMVVIILGKGFLSFFIVGDKGVPSWGFGTVLDVPGESAYAVYSELPYPQHIRGERGD